MQGNGKLTLELASRLTPPVNPVEAMRKQLALAVYDHASEKDIADMMGKLKEMALGGNLNAMKMWLKLTIGEGHDKSAAAGEPKGLAALADAVEDLVDEIRVAKGTDGKRRGSKAIGFDEDDD